MKQFIKKGEFLAVDKQGEGESIGLIFIKLKSDHKSEIAQSFGIYRCLPYRLYTQLDSTRTNRRNENRADEKEEFGSFICSSLTEKLKSKLSIVDVKASLQMVKLVLRFDI